MHARVPAILVSNPVMLTGELAAEARSDRPRIDYIELARLMGADLLGYATSGNRIARWLLSLERKTKIDMFEAWQAAQLRTRHSAILSTSEKIGIPYALLSPPGEDSVPHTLFGHKLSSGYKRNLLRYSRLARRFTHIVSDSPPQIRFAIEQLNVPDERVSLLADKVDTHFFQPQQSADDGYALAVGKEQRDYATFAEALRGTGIQGVIVVGSPWSTHKPPVPQDAGIRVLHSLPYTELRQVYAQARIVVMPLNPVDYAAGVTCVLEAMAMAKPLLLSNINGLEGYVTQNETGRHTRVGDAADLRANLLELWEAPAERKRLGDNGRSAVLAKHTLDNWLVALAKIVLQGDAQSL